MAATTESKKMITLCSSDGEEFKFKENIARGSQTIKHMIKDDCVESMILLPNDNGKILSKVIEYFKKHMCTPCPSLMTRGLTRSSKPETLSSSRSTSPRFLI